MLTLGKSFNRCYNLRLPFLNGFYNIGVYFNNKSSFLLFSIDPDFQKSSGIEHSVKINMYKNLESSKFCETFLIKKSSDNKKEIFIRIIEKLKYDYKYNDLDNFIENYLKSESAIYTKKSFLAFLREKIL